LYLAAQFLTREEMLALVTGSGLQLQCARLTSCRPLTDSPRLESS